ncbi:MAG: cytochrome P460 family protein [Rhodospirillales bacterium]|nr:MAG: cytochrome P460 family protein [Rhodospirillales bacterium]
MTDAEAAMAYDCVIGQLRAAYGKSGNAVAADYQGWQRYSRVAYQSATHGGRYVQNYANSKGRAYGAFEKAGRMPVGSTLAKDSFTVGAKGQVSPGPLFIMEKMSAGFNPDGGDWKYTMIMPNGAVFGVTGGKNAAGMQFCVDCHIAVGDDQDSMMLLPEEYRVQ